MQKKPVDIAPILQLVHVAKYFGDKKHQVLILDDINLEIKEGEFLAIVGPSGSGKSTLLRIITGLIPATSGDVFISQTPQEKAHNKVAIVFQTPSLFPWLNVLDNVEIGLRSRQMDPKLRSEKALKLIEEVGLGGFESAYPRELSRGMKQRVGFARALAVEPELLCLDEPFSGLDVLTADNLRRELFDLWNDKRVPLSSIIMVSHNIEEVALMADRVLVFGSNPGRVLANVPVYLEHPRERTSPEFISFVDHLYKLVSHSTAAAEPVKAAMTPVPEDEKKLKPLPDVRIGMLNGLIELLEKTGGKQDLPKLGADLQLEVDDLLPVAEAASQLGLAKVAEGDILLTDLGKMYAEAAQQEKKEIFKQQALSVEIIFLIIKSIDESPEKKIDATDILEILEGSFSKDAAESQLSIAIDWGRYAEMFSFDDDSYKLYLESEEQEKE
ncbi:MAG: ATP-binding cassette domain-containing protein [Dehalococcoidia bacterium]|nr:ATP-binding cassette domain-containing protein [Dehalococcoidia bacterium]